MEWSPNSFFILSRLLVLGAGFVVVVFVCLAYNQGWSLLGKSFMEIKAKPFHLVMLSQL